MERLNFAGYLALSSNRRRSHREGAQHLRHDRGRSTSRPPRAVNASLCDRIRAERRRGRDEEMPYATSVQGMFGVGDVRAWLSQACRVCWGEGSVVTFATIHSYLNTLE